MGCALVFYFVVTIFVVVYSLPELCVFRGGKRARCGRDDIEYTFYFIPPISRNITYIDLNGQPLKQLPYNAFRNLSSQSSISEIWLQHCQITHVDAGALLNLHNLITIELSYNQINQIDSKLFSHTKRIKYIYLDFNEIEVLPNGLFQNLPLLEAVSLEGNRIRQVERFSFKDTPSLRKIDLDDNQIEYMNMLFKDKFDNLTTLRLDDNPWKCNCELGPLYEFLIEINQLHEQELECEKPAILKGRKWSDIKRDKFVCRSEDAISTQDSVVINTEPITTTEQDDTIPVTVYNGTRYQNWIPYAILCLVLVCIVPVIIGVVFIVRRTPIIVKRSDRRTNASNLESDLPMLVVQSSAVSENSDSALNMADVDEEQTSIYHYDILEATTN